MLRPPRSTLTDTLFPYTTLFQSHYESILDPSLSWLTNLVLHEYNECWLYWSCMQTESDQRIKAIWELHLGMEIEHLHAQMQLDRKSTRLNSSHYCAYRMPSSA